MPAPARPAFEYTFWIPMKSNGKGPSLLRFASSTRFVMHARERDRCHELARDGTTSPALSNGGQTEASIHGMGRFAG
jgi:hypothetical protein